MLYKLRVFCTGTRRPKNVLVLVFFRIWVFLFPEQHMQRPFSVDNPTGPVPLFIHTSLAESNCIVSNTTPQWWMQLCSSSLCLLLLGSAIRKNVSHLNIWLPGSSAHIMYQIQSCKLYIQDVRVSLARYNMCWQNHHVYSKNPNIFFSIQSPHALSDFIGYILLYLPDFLIEV